LGRSGGQIVITKTDWGGGGSRVSGRGKRGFEILRGNLTQQGGSGIPGTLPGGRGRDNPPLTHRRKEELTERLSH